jgi:hypothetical protein
MHSFYALNPGLTLDILHKGSDSFSGTLLFTLLDLQKLSFDPLYTFDDFPDLKDHIHQNK